MNSLTLDAAIQMASGGSKVLLAEALEQAKAHGVTLMAGATTKPSGTGTRVGPGDVPNAVIGVARDDELYLVPPDAQLNQVNGAIIARLSDGAALLNARNLPPSDTWDLGVQAHKVSTVSAVGRSVVTDPDVTKVAIKIVEDHCEKAMWWAAKDSFTAIVQRHEAGTVEQLLHDALVTN